MGDKPLIMILGTECSPEWEEEWSKWYSEEHLPRMFYSCNARKATRYKIKYLPEEGEIARTAQERSQETVYPPYLSIYNFDKWDDVIAYYSSEARKLQVEKWNDWASKGARIIWRLFYETIQTWDQGTLVGDKPAIMFIGSECPPELVEAWGKWYAEKHIADFLKVEGIKGAARYQLRIPGEDVGIVPTETELTGKASHAPFLAVYDFDSFEAIRGYYNSDARPGLVEDWDKNWGSTGAKVVWRVFYEQIQTWEK